MPVVLLVRHGQASFGAADYDVLSELGQEQSRVVGREVARRGLRDPYAVTGGLRRQVDTARLAGLDAAVDERWDEYDHLALLERYVPADAPHDGTSRSVQALLDRALAAWTADTTGGFAAWRDGALDALGSLPAGRDAVVVTSGGVLAAVASALLGVDALVPLNRVTVNAAVTTVVVGRGGASLVSFNEHAHLPRALVTYR